MCFDKYMSFGEFYEILSNFVLSMVMPGAKTGEEQ